MTAAGARSDGKRHESEGGTARNGYAHQRLRADTAALHRLIDRQIMPAVMTRNAYARYLRVNYPVASIEPALAAAGVRGVLPDWHARQRLFALTDDLTALGIPRPHTSSIAIRNDPGTLFGWVYVIEGSRLGARLILRAVEAAGDPEMRDATRFLRHGEGLGLWTSFTAALSRIDADEVAITNACAAAREAFGLFIACAHGPVIDPDAVKH